MRGWWRRWRERLRARLRRRPSNGLLSHVKVHDHMLTDEEIREQFIKGRDLYLRRP